MLSQLGILGNAAVLVASLFALSYASKLAISNSVNLASITRLGKTKIGFILVAFSTSLPELFVAAFAVVNPGEVGISVGNVLGSNIVNICLILGLVFLIMSIKYPQSAGFFTNMAREEVGSLNFGLFIASLVPLVLLYVGYVGQIVGILLIAIFAFNMYGITKERKTVEEISDVATKRNLRQYVLLSILGIFGVIICAYFIVESASFVAVSVGVPPVIVGATVVAFGTSVPELATSIEAVRKGFIDLALGNIIGSCFLNITLILGVTLLLAPFQVNINAFSDLAIFSLIANLVLWYILQNTKINKREGTMLLIIYAVFLVISFSRAS